jgi:formate dehydrogenase accessory protein FdhD
VEIAEKTGLTIVGFVRAGKMNIYSHPQRITGSEAVSGTLSVE